MASKKANFKKQLVAYSFLAPNFIGFAIFTLVPIVFAVVLAFLRWDGANPMEWAGFSNFSELFDLVNYCCYVLNAPLVRAN